MRHIIAITANSILLMLLLLHARQGKSQGEAVFANGQGHYASLIFQDQTFDYSHDLSSLTFTNSTFRGECHVANYSSNNNRPGVLMILDSHGEMMSLNGSLKQIELIRDTIESIKIVGSVAADYDSYSQDYTNSMRTKALLHYSKFSNLSIQNIVLQDFQSKRTMTTSKFSIRDAKIVGRFNLDFDILPDTVELINVDLSEIDGVIDFTKSIHSEDRPPIQLIVFNTDISKIKLDYQSWTLCFPPKWKIPFEIKNGTFEALRLNIAKEGQVEGLEKLEKELRYASYTKDSSLLGAFANWVDATWWDYGYNRWLIFRGCAFFMFIFFVVNLFCFDFLVAHVYHISNFQKVIRAINIRFVDRKIVKWFAKMPYAMLYTFFVFWGLRLDIASIEIRRWGWVTYIIVQYVTGLACLATLANFIVSYL